MASFEGFDVELESPPPASDLPISAVFRKWLDPPVFPDGLALALTKATYGVDLNPLGDFGERYPPVDSLIKFVFRERPDELNRRLRWHKAALLHVDQIRKQQIPAVWRAAVLPRRPTPKVGAPTIEVLLGPLPPTPAPTAGRDEWALAYLVMYLHAKELRERLYLYAKQFDGVVPDDYEEPVDPPVPALPPVEGESEATQPARPVSPAATATAASSGSSSSSRRSASSSSAAASSSRHAAAGARSPPASSTSPPAAPTEPSASPGADLRLPQPSGSSQAGRRRVTVPVPTRAVGQEAAASPPPTLPPPAAAGVAPSPPVVAPEASSQGVSGVETTSAPTSGEAVPYGPPPPDPMPPLYDYCVYSRSVLKANLEKYSKFLEKFVAVTLAAEVWPLVQRYAPKAWLALEKACWERIQRHFLRFTSAADGHQVDCTFAITALAFDALRRQQAEILRTESQSNTPDRSFVALVQEPFRWPARQEEYLDLEMFFAQAWVLQSWKEHLDPASMIPGHLGSEPLRVGLSALVRDPPKVGFFNATYAETRQKAWLQAVVDSALPELNRLVGDGSAHGETWRRYQTERARLSWVVDCRGVTELEATLTLMERPPLLPGGARPALPAVASPPQGFRAPAPLARARGWPAGPRRPPVPPDALSAAIAQGVALALGRGRGGGPAVAGRGGRAKRPREASTGSLTPPPPRAQAAPVPVTTRACPGCNKEFTAQADFVVCPACFPAYKREMVANKLRRKEERQQKAAAEASGGGGGGGGGGFAPTPCVFSVGPPGLASGPPT